MRDSFFCTCYTNHRRHLARLRSVHTSASSTQLVVESLAENAVKEEWSGVSVDSFYFPLEDLYGTDPSESRKGERIELNLSIFHTSLVQFSWLYVYAYDG